MDKCGICKKPLQLITGTHLRIHGLSLKKYKARFPRHSVGFTVRCNILPKSDPRYKRWRESLLGRKSWRKGKTKDTDPKLMKISETMKRKKMDNFKIWREKMKQEGKIKNEYPELPENTETAELVGLVLGDGNLYKFARCEQLTISYNSAYPQIIKRGEYLIKKAFGKKPTIRQMESQNCTRMWVYEKRLGERLGIPVGAKRNYILAFPKWILGNKEHLIACLIGLYNAEGSYSIHLPTGTYNLQFSNTNKGLLREVYKALTFLGYNPHLRENKVTLRRKEETEKFANLIKFRYYRS